MTVGIHAERVIGDPDAVRWVVPPGIVPVGRVRAAPGPLGAMFDDGSLRRGLAEHTAVWLWLRPDLSWAARGAAVRSALLEALDSPGGWVVERAPGEVLGLVTNDVLDGSVGDFVRSHGGSVTTEHNDDGTIDVRLGGACEHCAAAESTLRSRLMGELRKRCPDLTEVNRAKRGAQQGGTRLTLAMGG